LEQVYQF